MGGGGGVFQKNTEELSTVYARMLKPMQRFPNSLEKSLKGIFTVETSISLSQEFILSIN